MWFYTEYCDNWMAELAGNYVTQGLEVTKDIVGVMCGNDDLASQAVKVLSENRLAGKVLWWPRMRIWQLVRGLWKVHRK